MSDIYAIKPIAKIYTDFNERFGIPRQAGLIEDLTARIIFEKEFRDINAIRGIEEFSHLWLIWRFTETAIDMTADRISWAPLVAPPRLGGRIKKGVFATRSPYRPNSMGLSSVKLLDIDYDCSDGPALIVGGADILNGTDILDIKPYVPYSDSHPDASGGFSVSSRQTLKVDFPQELLSRIAADKQQALIRTLMQDPRGAYEKQPGYVYGLSFADYDIRFTIADDTLTVFDVITRPSGKNNAAFNKIK